jgi:hypothetical protein
MKPPTNFNVKTQRKIITSVEDEEMMKIVTVVQENVVVKDISASKFHDLLVLQAALPPEAVLEPVRVEFSMSDPNSGTLSERAKPIRKSWTLQNPSLTNEIERLLHLAWNRCRWYDSTSSEAYPRFQVAGRPQVSTKSARLLCPWPPRFKNTI